MPTLDTHILHGPWTTRAASSEGMGRSPNSCGANSRPNTTALTAKSTLYQRLRPADASPCKALSKAKPRLTQATRGYRLPSGTPSLAKADGPTSHQASKGGSSPLTGAIMRLSKLVRQFDIAAAMWDQTGISRRPAPRSRTTRTRTSPMTSGSSGRPGIRRLARGDIKWMTWRST